ncbi:MAG TPA: amidohydrolase family protein [Candidatus Aquabacterium excrementipullorum]|nr:amidohydrolase family protein [Candidatus Aquabacterium excrementipullorum]
MSTNFSGWDCHAHLFGPYAQYPLAADRSYTPPEAAEVQYAALLDKLQLGHGVLVHPSAYADDLSLLLDTLARRPAWRGVIVTTAVQKLDLTPLRSNGIRASRFSHRSGAGGNFAGSASFDDLRQLAPALADAGLHAELWTDCRSLPDIADELLTLPVPVVIDHMGGFDPSAGVDDPGFKTLLLLLESGRVWVKLCAYRNFLGRDDQEALAPLFQQAMLKANPQRLLWGSDWPHLRVTPEPNTSGLKDAFVRWTGDQALVRQVLELNPAALYE